ncbi:hypothetical protein ACVMIH_007706 [Bradyrhizobium sp. USDA 4503]
MISKPDDLPSDLASAYLALLAEREALQAERDVAVADAASARAEPSDNEALIAHLELRIEKLKRELHGQRSERSACSAARALARSDGRSSDLNDVETLKAMVLATAEKAARADPLESEVADLPATPMPMRASSG